MSPRILLKLFAAATWAALVCRSFSTLMDNKSYAYASIVGDVLGTRTPVFFGRFTNGMEYAAWELVIFGIIGVIGGLIGGAFNWANKQLTRRRKMYMPAPKVKKNGLVDIRRGDLLRFAEVLIVTLFISSIQFWLPALMQGLEQGRWQPVRYKDLSKSQQLFWESGTGSLKSLLHDEDSFDEYTLALFFVVHLCCTCLTYGLGVPSGLFVPSLLAGAAMGRLVGQAVVVHGAARPGIYALVGATAMLSGAARITISLAMILMEVTGEAAFSLPLMMTVMIARWVGNKFGRGIYDMHIVDLKRVPLLEYDPEDCMLNMTAKEVMATSVVSCKEINTVLELHSMLSTCTHHGFPVLNEEGRMVALVERDILTFLVNCGEQYGVFEEHAQVVPYTKTSLHIAKSPSLKLLEDLGPVLDMCVDLRPYMIKSYHTMQENASLYACYKLFRGLGLRHLIILSEKDGRVSGMITRKNLILIEDADDELMGNKPKVQRVSNVCHRRKHTSCGALDVT